MRQDQFIHACALGHLANLRHIGVEPGHPPEGLTNEAEVLEVVEVGDAVHENVRAVGQGDRHRSP